VPTSKPRVSVTLEPTRYRFLKAWAEKRNLPVSQVIGALVDQMAGLLAAAEGGLLSPHQPALFPESVVGVLGDAFPMKEDREALARLGGALDALRLTGGWSVLSEHLRGVAAGGAAAGEHPAQPPAAPAKQSTEATRQARRPPLSNQGGHKREPRGKRKAKR